MGKNLINHHAPIRPCSQNLWPTWGASHDLTSPPSSRVRRSVTRSNQGQRMPRTIGRHGPRMRCLIDDAEESISLFGAQCHHASFIGKLTTVRPHHLSYSIGRFQLGRASCNHDKCTGLQQKTFRKSVLNLPFQLCSRHILNHRSRIIKFDKFQIAAGTVLTRVIH